MYSTIYYLNLPDDILLNFDGANGPSEVHTLVRSRLG